MSASLKHKSGVTARLWGGFAALAIIAAAPLSQAQEHAAQAPAQPAAQSAEEAAFGHSVPPHISASRAPPLTTIDVDEPGTIPAWAMAERALMTANAEGVQLFTQTYIDNAGHARAPAHCCIADGSDDAVEPIRNWPIAHALGGDDSIIRAWQFVYEGHIDQYSRARIPEVPAFSDGIYYREFVPQFDWEHIGEGISGFIFYALSQPDDPRYITRLRRFAGLYMNEDPQAQNYDPQHHLIRSLVNGSRGPRLTPMTVNEWDGPQYPNSDPERRTRFVNALNVVGDHPLNLGAVNLAFNAYMATGEEKYRAWALEYVNAWRDRINANGGNIPSNIGLDGSIGGSWGGKWYGGVFGWNSPEEGHRNYVLRGPPEAFGDALLLTGDQHYTGVIRRQLDNLYAQARVVNGHTQIPVYYGDHGWYGFYDVDGRAPGLGNHRKVETDVYMWGLEAHDLARLPRTGWIGYLQGAQPDYPLQALQGALDEVRIAARHIREDQTSMDYPVGITRWERSNPVSTTALVNLTLGANDPGGSGHGPVPLHAQVRYFDPDHRRAGLSPDLAALVSHIDQAGVTLTLVNTSPIDAHSVIVETGGYGEHRCMSVRMGDGASTPCDGRFFAVRLAPGSVQTFTIAMRRYAYRPTIAFPWNQGAPIEN